MTGPVVVIVDPYSSGVMYAPALRKAGFSPVAVISAPGPAPDFTSTLRPKDFDVVLAADDGLIDRLAPMSPVAVLPGTESGVELADRLADQLTPRRANSPQLAPARRHKGAMVAAVAARGIPVARTVTARRSDQVERWIADEGLTGVDLVVKPAMSAGTEGVQLARGGEGWRPAMAGLLGRTNAMGVVDTDVVIQERVTGTEYAIDTFSHDGLHTVTDICRYGKVDIGPNFAVYDHVEFVAYDDDGHAELVRYVERVLDALGIRFGSAHTEVMLTADGPRLIETNARLAGGGIPGAAWLATGETGVDRLIDQLRGAPDVRLDFTLHRSVLTMLFMAPQSGIVSNVEAYYRIRELRTCRHLRVKVGNGDFVPATSDLMSTTRLGWAVLADRDHQRVRADHASARAIAAEVRIEGGRS